jgi:hypothetical protein
VHSLQPSRQAMLLVLMLVVELEVTPGVVEWWMAV